MIKVLFFAQLSDLAKCQSLGLELGELNQVRDLLDVLKTHVPEQLTDQLKDKTAMVSINQQFATWDSPLSDGDEVGFLPPVSGG